MTMSELRTFRQVGLRVVRVTVAGLSDSGLHIYTRPATLKTQRPSTVEHRHVFKRTVLDSRSRVGCRSSQATTWLGTLYGYSSYKTSHQ